MGLEFTKCVELMFMGKKKSFFIFKEFKLFFVFFVFCGVSDFNFHIKTTQSKVLKSALDLKTKVK